MNIQWNEYNIKKKVSIICLLNFWAKIKFVNLLAHISPSSILINWYILLAVKTQNFLEIIKIHYRNNNNYIIKNKWP